MVNKKAFFLTIAVIIILDQITKYIAKASFNYTTNTGSLFGLFQGSSTLLIWFSLIVIGIFFFYYEKIQQSHLIVKIGSGLIIGGTIGNLIDRILYKAVIDFIDLKIWPSFNIADSALSIGVFLLIIYILFEGKFKKTNKNFK